MGASVGRERVGVRRARRASRLATFTAVVVWFGCTFLICGLVIVALYDMVRWVFAGVGRLKYRVLII